MRENGVIFEPCSFETHPTNDNMWLYTVWRLDSCYRDQIRKVIDTQYKWHILQLQHIKKS